jgi:ssRNA-specific RNase YbeY (16S rRNA maturation enzyme)
MLGFFCLPVLLLVIHGTISLTGTDDQDKDDAEM